MKRYEQDFKNEVIGKYLAGETIVAISRETGVNENVLHRWKQKMVASDNGYSFARGDM